MNTVVPLPPNDGSQPAGEAHSSRLTPLAAPIPTPQASSPRLRATQASNAGDCVPPFSSTRPALLGGSGGEPSIPSEDAGGAKMDGANHPGRGPSGLIRSAKSSQAATDIDPAFFAATRESQGQPVDAIPRIGDWPFTVNREGWLIDMRDGSIAYDMMAQLGLGIGRV
jgi:hypothetical protein